MRITRVLDLAVLLLLAAVVLMPRPSVRVKPALDLSAERKERVAELQSQLMKTPGALAPSLELAGLFLDARRPHWALSVLGDASVHHARDHRIHFLRALAYAERFEGDLALRATEEALQICDGSQADEQARGAGVCDDTARTRLAYLKHTLSGVAHLDMRKNLAATQEALLKQMRPSYVVPSKLTAKDPSRPVETDQAVP